jgi:hypothetical protein
LLELDEPAPAVAIIRSRLVVNNADAPGDKIVTIRLIYEDEAGRPTGSGSPGAVWRIYTYLL